MTEQELIQRFLEDEESQIFECKRAKKKPAGVLPTLCAFANSDGGFFVYGLADKERVDKNDRIFGLSEAENHADDLLTLLGKEFDPPISGSKHLYLDCINSKGQKDRILVIQIFPSKDVHSLRSGDTYIRRGRKNERFTHKQSLQLQYEKGSISFEAEALRGSVH